MREFFSKCYTNFINSEISIKTSIVNAILCGCMAYFYYDSGLIIPLLYGAFFLIYPFIVFIAGEKAIPVLYAIYSIGAIQDINFLNATMFIMFMFIAWQFPKWEIPLTVIYIIEIVIVCVRHNKTPVHLLFHIGFCLSFYTCASVVKKTIEKRSILRISENFKPLDLKPEEEAVIKQKAEGKLMKEITGVSKNTRTAYIQAAMKRNGCKTPEELVALYSLQRRFY